jgi:hypothetical protein
MEDAAGTKNLPRNSNEKFTPRYYAAYAVD